MARAKKPMTAAERQRLKRQRERGEAPPVEESPPALEREPVAPAPAPAAEAFKAPPPVLEVPAEVAQLDAADLAPPPLAAEVQLPPEAIAAAAAAEPLPAAPADTPPPPPPPPPAEAMAVGEQLAAVATWARDRGLARHKMPPLVEAVMRSDMLIKLARSSGTECAAKYGITAVKPPPEVGVAIVLGVSAWCAFGPPIGVDDKKPGEGAPAEERPTMVAGGVPAAPWASSSAAEVNPS